MTCIVATARYVCADRRITEDGGASSSLVKVAKNPWLIAAAAGLTTSTLAVKRAVRAGAESSLDLLPLVGPDSQAVVLLWNGTLELISEGAIWAVPGRVVAIGSGGDLAIGFMHGAGSVSPTCARAAQRFVSRRRVDCGGGCDVRSFE